MMAYFAALNAMCDRMLPAFSVALGLAPDYFAPYFANEAHANLRFALSSMFALVRAICQRVLTFIPWTEPSGGLDDFHRHLLGGRISLPETQPSYISNMRSGNLFGIVRIVEAAGVEFLAANDTAGIGVRLKKADRRRERL
jgi:hypothetical protein